MAYDAGLVERLRDALARVGERGARERGVFGGRGFLLGKSTFVIAWGDGIIAKMAPDEYEEALALPGISPFAPGGECPMGTWVVVAPDVVADDPELMEWVERALRGVRAASTVKRPATKRTTTKRPATKRPATKRPARKAAAKRTTAQRPAKPAAARKAPARKPARDR